jgi:hypothetical protein
MLDSQTQAALSHCIVSEVKKHSLVRKLFSTYQGLGPGSNALTHRTKHYASPLSQDWLANDPISCDVEEVTIPRLLIKESWSLRQFDFLRPEHLKFEISKFAGEVSDLILSKENELILQLLRVSSPEEVLLEKDIESTLGRLSIKEERQRRKLTDLVINRDVLQDLEDEFFYSENKRSELESGLLKLRAGGFTANINLHVNSFFEKSFALSLNSKEVLVMPVFEDLTVNFDNHLTEKIMTAEEVIGLACLDSEAIHQLSL